MSKPDLILWQDDHLVVVNKLPGVLSIPDRYNAKRPNIKRQLEAKLGPLWTVHRIDADTSGILILARHAKAHQHLSMQFERRLVEKTYHALVDGCPHPSSGWINKPLGPHPGKPGQMIVSSKGKESRTHFQLVEAFAPCSLLEVRIETGRMHQIRVHMQSIGHPLWVDPVYGRREAFYLSSIKGSRYRTGKFEEEKPLLSRLSLHAARIRFEHPETGAPIHLEAPYPKDLAATLKQIRKWAPPRNKVL